jgi:Asp-tRNA(Asn)/Glu-tRNA(Gln) amidotransferase C subunit
MAAKLKNTKGVLVGLSIVDNLTRIEDGKEALKKADLIKNLSDILDFFENNDEVLKMGAKIYSKISKSEDILIEIEKLRKYDDSNDFSDLNELKKTLVLISNFVLVDDISKTLCEPENLKIIKNLFIKISNIELKNKSGEYIKAYVLLNKYFMIIFHRIFNLIPEFFEDEEIEKNINKSILNNWKAINLIRQNAGNQSEDELNSFIGAFSEFFRSFAEFYEKNYSKKEPEENTILSILDFFLNDKIFNNDEKANNSACKIIKIANRIKANKANIRDKIMTLFDFLISTVKFSDDSETLNYASEILHDIYQDRFSKNSISSLEVDKDGIIRYFNVMQSPSANGFNEGVVKENVSKYFNIRDILLKVVPDFMMKKPKHRKPVINLIKLMLLLIFFFKFEFQMI